MGLMQGRARRALKRPWDLLLWIQNPFSVSRAEPLARYLRFEALNPIQIFAAEKPAAGVKAE